MYLDYSKIKSGQREQPMLRLRTLSEKELGPIPFAHDVKFTINYSDVSTLTFTVPCQVNGTANPLYEAIGSYKEVYTENLGIYILMSPSKSGDGIQETKTVTGYSLEHTFQTKSLFLSEGTYNFWDPVNPKDTVLGRVLELDPSWSTGYVAPRLIGCYRKFDEYNDDALSFCYNDAMETYRCAFVFDVYKKTVNVYDANDDAENLPIYLSYENLLDTVGVDEVMDEFSTKLHLYGSDGLSINSVNPTGMDYLVNLDYFLNGGDLDVRAGERMLSDRVREWQVGIATNQAYFAGEAAAKASLTAQKLAHEAELTELNGELDNLTNQQSITIQAIALEPTEEKKILQQKKLDEINFQIERQKEKILAQKAQVEEVCSEIERHTQRINAIVEEFGPSSYFTPEEQRLLAPFLIESTLEEETFVATDLETSTSGAISSVSGEVTLTRSNITKVRLEDFEKDLYVLSNGSLKIDDEQLNAKLIRGTLDTKADGSYVLTGYLGDTSFLGQKCVGGLITLSGVMTGFTSDITTITEDEISQEKGSQLQFSTVDSQAFFTVNASEFQQYSVEVELYDFGKKALDDYAWPVYEFSVNSGNFLYQEKFEPFKDKLELGKAIYLELGSSGRVNAKIIGIELDFNDISNFNLVFSNRYRLKNGMESWIDEIKSASRSSRSLDASKHIYNLAADKATEVDRFMNGQIDAAVNTILGAKNQSVQINGSGIQIGGDSKYQMRLVNNMIAMTDDGWKTAKLPIGRFAADAKTGKKDSDGNDILVGEVWGVNAEMLAGKLIVGNNMVLQNPLVDGNRHPTGAMMFQVDATGAWLYNSRLILQDGETGGLVIVDPRYGIVAGTKLLFDTDGTTVTPEFMNETGDITFDSAGMPENANFFLDVKNGNAYFRGKIVATGGKIGGFTIADSYLYSGEGGNRVALNGGATEYPLFALWAGNEDPNLAPFWVKKSGEMKATDGTFSGTLKTSKLVGNLTADKNTGGWLRGVGISVGGSNYQTGKGNFYVDPYGNMDVRGTAYIGGSTTIAGAYLEAPTIYGGTFYAAESRESVENGNSYAKLDASSFTLYQDGTPKLALNYTDVGTDQAKISLGNVSPAEIRKEYADLIGSGYQAHWLSLECDNISFVDSAGRITLQGIREKLNAIPGMQAEIASLTSKVNSLTSAASELDAQSEQTPLEEGI